MILSKNNNFDILRLLLAILVFFAHWNILTNQQFDSFIFKQGDLAVHLFFIVSGFLIFWSYDTDQNNKRFYIKRFFRIYPIYVLLIVLQTVFFALNTSDYISLFRYFLFNSIFLNFLAPSVGEVLSGLQVDAINGSLWTLKNEIIFYLLIPVIHKLYSKFGLKFIVFSYGMSVFYMFLVNYLGYDKLLVQFPAQVRLFAVGIFLYHLTKIQNTEYRIQNYIYVIALLSILFVVLFNNIYFKYLLYPVCLGFVMLAIVFYLKIIKIEFDFSYSLYVFHFPVIQLFLFYNLNPLNPLESFITLFSLVIVLSYFSEKYIEKRFVRIGRNLAKNVISKEG